jgi:hypothetical protein
MLSFFALLIRRMIKKKLNDRKDPNDDLIENSLLKLEESVRSSDDSYEASDRERS